MNQPIKTAPLTRYEAAVVSFLRNAVDQRGPKAETFIALRAEKGGALKLEARGIVSIRRTTEKTAGLSDWYVSLTATGHRVVGF